MMSEAAWINGEPAADPARTIAFDDRGLNYGDGLFETALLRDGALRFATAHLRRLRQGCERLGIAYPGDENLIADIAGISAAARHGVIKIIVTRGGGGRGYRPAANAASTRIVALHPLPAPCNPAGIAARCCEVRLGRNPALAGMKHLNRLEQVLAQRECRDAGVEEGLMLDTEGELICATTGNVFLGRRDALFTPDLRYCGVHGVMRAQVLEAAVELGIATSVEPLRPRDLHDATEVFITNAVRGIRPLIALDELQWQAGPLASRLTAALEL